MLRHPISFRHSLLAAPLALLLTVPVQAAVPADDAAADDQSTIIITGTRANQPVSASKMPTAIVDTPQSVTVIDAQAVADRAASSLGQVLAGIPGVSVGQGEGHRDQIVLRGQPTTADFFVDGVRDDVQYYRGLYNVERIEILKGPNAMTFGRGGGGGIVNRVEKRPFNDSLVGGQARIDSFGAWALSADLNQPLAMGTAGRLNATYEDFRSNRDFVTGHRWAVNPTLGFGIGSDTQLMLGYEHSQDDRVIDRGIPSQNGRPAKGYRDTYFGSRDGGNRMAFNGDVLRADASTRLEGGLRLDAHVLYGDYDKLYLNVLPNSEIQNGTVKLYAYGSDINRKNLFGQLNLLWEGEGAGLKHSILAGIDAGSQRSRSRSASGRFAGVTGDLWVPVTDPLRMPAVSYSFAAANRSRVTTLGAYVQDQIKLGAFAELLLGLRYDRFHIRSTSGATGASLERTDSYLSPRAGLVLHPAKDVSLYASYATTFLPQSGDQFSSIDANSKTMEPEKFVNYEIGAKWQANPALLLTLAAYQLDRTNTRAHDPAKPGAFLLSGKQRSRGIEFEATGKLLPNWSVTAGAAIQDAKVVETTSAAKAGTVMALVPEFMASLWTRYDVSDRIGLGLGVEHQGERFAQLTNKVTLPAFTRIDAALFARLTDNVSAQVNVQNLFNVDYWPTAHVDNNIQPGAPRNASVSLRFAF